MPSCTVCRHADRAEIDLELVSAAPLRDVAGRHGLARSSVHRHAVHHVPEVLRRSHDAVEVLRADDLLGELRLAQNRTWRVLEAAEERGDPALVLKALARVERQIELKGRLLAAAADCSRTDADSAPVADEPVPEILEVYGEYQTLLAAIVADRIEAVLASEGGPDGQCDSVGAMSSGRAGHADRRHPATAVDDQGHTTGAVPEPVPDEDAYIDELVRLAAPAVVRVIVEA
jgi:hypothetical protein